MAGSRVLPQALAQRARAFVASGLVAVEARPASTVVMVRDAAAGLEVYVHRRHRGMAFAGGMLAFPGGGVDPVDNSTVGADAEAWAARLGAEPAAAWAFVRAALRETEEETGVVLQPEDLLPWAHWITPRFEERRFDTWFFLAGLTAGQQPQDVSGETEHVAWVRPGDALAAASRGESVMLPPTQLVLEELSAFDSVGAALAAGPERTIEAIMPAWIDDGEVVRALLPDDPEYPGDDVEVRA
ncbi:MAG TPA: NUDIX hydrolase [Jiangellaceae bacterium]|nr:NUDIX hydrolase [Jiangellaceae bacterium]